MYDLNLKSYLNIMFIYKEYKERFFYISLDI